VLHAEFETKTSGGAVEKGQYGDTWLSNDKWRREASIGKSRYVRSRKGERRYELAEGSDVGSLRFVLKTVEPIPAIDTFVDSDWRIKRDPVGGIQAVRVLAGYESPEGKLDPRQIDVHKDGRLGMRIRVTEVAPGASLPASNFEVKGHEWQRAFTAEER
jgi:hypothetical protein